MKSLRHITILGALCAIVVASAAPTAAAAVIGMNQWGINTQALELPGGSWIEDENWGYTGNSAWMNEVWVGGPGSQVAIGASVDVDETRAVTPIDITKSVENTSSFFWTDFHVDLIPAGGGTLSNVTADPSAQFGNVAIIDNLDGSFTINWDNFGNNGTGVGIGETAILDFGFDIDGDIIFTIQQTPTPEPGALALLLAGGMLLRRRKS